MRDRWDEEDGPGERGREPEPTLGDTIDGGIRKVTTSLIIAAGLIALGLYGGSRGGGGDTVPDYQMVSGADGRIYRLNTDSGSIVACQDGHCWLMQRGNHGLEDTPPEQNKAALPAAAPSPAAPQQAVPAQPAPAQLPAPQNQQAPAPAAR